MTKFNELLSDFRSGEISPKFYGRKGLEEHATGAQLLNNFIPMSEGGFTKRGGSEFMVDVSALATGTGKGPALIPFISKKDEGFVIVINADGVAYGTTPWIIIYRNDGAGTTIVPPPGGLDSIPPADLDPKGFNYAQIGDVIWITHSSGRFMPIIIRGDVDAGIFYLNDFDDLNISVPKDPNYGKVNPLLRVPYRDRNISAITLTPAATSGSGINLTASAVFFNAGHVGAYIRVIHAGTEGVAKVVGFTSTTVVTVDILINFGAITASDNWAESAWSTYRGFPRTVAAFEQRLVWGGAILDPDTLWFSLIANPFLMMQVRLIQDLAGDTSGLNYFIPSGIPVEQQVFNGVGVQFLESDPFSFTLSSTEANPVSWMSSGRDLSVGTLGAEYIISSDGGLSILTVSARKQTNYGGAPVKVARSINEVLYFTRNGQSLRSFKYNDANGSYLSAKVSLLGEHMRKIGNDVFDEYAESQEFLDIFLQQGRDIIWVINSKNQLIGLNYSRENNNIGWFRTQFPNGTTFPVAGFNSCQIWGVTVIPNEDGENDDVWMVVERENSGGSVFLLERMGAVFDGESLYEGNVIDENIPLFLDSSVIVDNTAGAALSVITGLAHLNGHTVTVVYNGTVLSSYLVAAGQITLSAGDTVTVTTPGILLVGIKYTAEFESLDLEAGLNIGTSEGQVQRIDRAYYRFYNSKNVKAGSILRQDTVKFLGLSGDTTLSSESIRVDIPNSPGVENRTRLISEDPFPCTVLSMAIRGNTYD